MVRGCVGAFLVLVVLPHAVLSQSHWERLNVPNGGHPSFVHVDSSRHIVTNDDRRIHESEDGGVTWRSLFEVPGQPAFDATLLPNGNFLAVNDALRLSMDDGQSWRTIAEGVSSFSRLQSGLVMAVLNKPLASGLVAYRSTNDGETWDGIYKLISKWPDTVTSGVVMSTNGLLFCGGDSTVWISANKGNTWTKSTLATRAVYQKLLVCDDTVVALGCRDSIWQDRVQATRILCMKSFDRGATWTAVPDLFSSDKALKLQDALYSNGALWAVLLHDNREKRVLRSSDSGLWSYIDFPLKSKGTSCFAKMDRQVLLSDSYLGLYTCSTEGSRFEQFNFPFGRSTAVAARKALPIYVASESGIDKSVDHGVSWEHVCDSLHYISDLRADGSLDALDHYSIFAESQSYSSTAEGRTWTEGIPNQLRDQFGSTVRWTVAVYDHHSGNITPGWIEIERQGHQAIFGPNDDYLHAPLFSQMLSSANGWTTLLSPGAALMTTISPEDSFRAQFLAAATSAVLDNTGNLWTSSSDGIQRIDPVTGNTTFFMDSFASSALAADSAGDVYVANSSGLFATSDHGASWVLLADPVPLGYGPVRTLCWGNNGYLYAADSIGPLFRIALPTLDVHSSATTLMLSITLDKQSVTVRLANDFSLTTARLTDVAGRDVRLLQISRLSRGRYRIELPGHLRGLYYLLLEAQGSATLVPLDLN